MDYRSSSAVSSVMTLRLNALFLSVSAVFGQQAITSAKSPFLFLSPATADLDTLAFPTMVPDFEARDLTQRTWGTTDRKVR